MRGYKTFEGDPHPGDLKHLIEIGYTENRVNENGYPVEDDMVENGSYYSYRLFHAGMATPVPIANGGTGASTAKAALTNLGVFYAETLPDTGEDGQICLVPV